MMCEQFLTTEATLPDGNAGLQTVLAAWHTATLRLEETHRSLQAEVRRLTAELEVKNRELARKNRLADLGLMASHVAHEVRNNLVPVTLYLSLLRRRLSDDPGSLSTLDKIAAGLTELNATVNDLELLQFTVDRDPQLQRFSLRRLIDEVHLTLVPQLAAQAIETTINVADELPITADPEMLRRAVLNLALSAVDAMPEGGTLEVTATDGPWGVELRISDSGAGLSEEGVERAFEPFFITRPGGTGLELAIVYRIVEAHGGSITAANCPAGGTVFTLHIPHLSAVLEAAA